jgi:hypothetical protein
VGIRGEIVDLPNFGGTHLWVLSNRIGPQTRYWCCGRPLIFNLSEQYCTRPTVPHLFEKSHLGSTCSTGQVRPLTTMVLPKNSGFQIGGTSVASSAHLRELG